MSRNEQDYWQRAWDELELWEDTFRPVDSAIAEFAESHGMISERWRHDAPCVILRWTEATGLARSVELFLKGMPGSFRLRVSGISWKDNPNTRRRYGKCEVLSELSVPIDQSELRNALDDGYRIISAWQEADLRRTTKISSIPEQ